MKTDTNYQKIVPFIFFIFALLLFFTIVKPMITIVLSSILIAYISYPIYSRLRKKLSHKPTSIILALLIVFIIILIPFTILVIQISQQGYLFYHSISSNVAKGAIFGFGCTGIESKVCTILNQVEAFSLEKLTVYGFDRQIQEYLPVFKMQITKLILQLPIIIAQVFLTFVIAYFILKEWKAILKKISHILPLRQKNINKLVNEFGEITHTVVYAQLFVALIQGIVGTIGFYLAGAPFPFVLGVLVAFCALIPTIGTSLIWIPTSAYLIIGGYFSTDYWMMGKGIGLFVYGLFIISTIDNILLAKIIHAKSKVNQIIIIIGVIGGATLFGFPGIFIGPILLPLLITYFETFKEEVIHKS
jgi:predicted PurR-regulated permease PerM